MAYLLSILLISIIAEIVIPPHDSLFQGALAGSPSFLRREALGNSNDLYYVYGNPPVTNPRYIDMQSVNYFSDGKYFNATIWLDSFVLTPPTDHDKVNYGIYFDTDFNSNTGVEGIDYKVEISWDKKNQTWTKVFEEWGGKYALGKNTPKAKILSEEPAKNFFERCFSGASGSCITLSADLGLMLYPDRYRVAFYAEEADVTKDGSDATAVVDGTNWVSIPPPKYNLTITPNPLILKQGESSEFQVTINSSPNTELSVELKPIEEDDRDKDFILSEPVVLHVTSSDTFRSAHLDIVADNSATDTIHTIKVNANVTPAVDRINAIPFLAATDENKTEVLQFDINVEEWGWIESANDTIDNVLTPIVSLVATVSGIIGGALGWIYGLRQKNKNKNNN